MGILLFEMLTGKVPFQDAKSPMKVLMMHARDPIPVPSAVAPTRGISAEVDRLVLKALAKNPDDRFQSMKELAEVCKHHPDALVRRPTGVANHHAMQATRIGVSCGRNEVSAVHHIHELHVRVEDGKHNRTRIVRRLHRVRDHWPLLPALADKHGGLPPS